MQEASIEDLNRRTKESYVQREKKPYDRNYFSLRKSIFEVTVTNRVRQTLERVGLLQGAQTVNILDIGCKYGDKTDAIVRATVSDFAEQIDVLGIDLHLPNIQYQPKDQRINLIRREIPLEELEIDSAQKYDVISAMAVTHHFPDLDRAFAKMQQLLAPNGVIFMADHYYKRNILRDFYTTVYQKLECDGYFNRKTQQEVLNCMQNHELEIVAQMWGFPMLGVTLAKHQS